MICRLFLLILLLPAELLAAQSEPIDLFLSGFKMFIGLVIVIGIMLLVHILNRKGFKFLERRHAGRIRIMETRPVGGRKSLCLVEIRGEEILLGIGNERIDFLHHFASSPPDTRFEDELRECGEAEK